MAERERDTVVVEDNRRPSYGWLIALIILAIMVVLFFLFGGFDMFGGGASTETINVDAPDSVNVQPAN